MAEDEDSETTKDTPEPVEEAPAAAAAAAVPDDVTVDAGETVPDEAAATGPVVEETDAVEENEQEVAEDASAPRGIEDAAASPAAQSTEAKDVGESWKRVNVPCIRFRVCVCGDGGPYMYRSE